MPGPFRFLGRFSIQCVWGPRGFADPFPPPYSDTLIAHAHTHTHMYSLQHTGNIAQINFAEGFQSRLHVLNNDYGHSDGACGWFCAADRDGHSFSVRFSNCQYKYANQFPSPLLIDKNCLRVIPSRAPTSVRRSGSLTFRTHTHTNTRTNTSHALRVNCLRSDKPSTHRSIRINFSRLKSAGNKKK